MSDLEWPDGLGVTGVHTLEGRLLWWSRPGGPNGRFGEAARSQSFEDFRENGPAVSCPEDIEATLQKAFGREHP